jgi:hypothetical protein
MIEQEQLLVVRDCLLVGRLGRQKKVGWQPGRLLGRRLSERLQSQSGCFGQIQDRG